MQSVEQCQRRLTILQFSVLKKKKTVEKMKGKKIK